MAKAAINKKLTTKPKKAPRVSRSSAKSIADKYYGPEPIDVSVKGLVEALNWYNYMYEHEEALSFLFDYLKKNGYSKADVAAVRKLPKYRIPKTVCSVARILLNGNELPEKNMNYFTDNVTQLIQMGKSLTKIKEVAEVESDKNVVSIQDRVKAKINQLVTDCEEAFDADPTFSVYEWLKGKEASAQAAIAIRDYYLPSLEEIVEGGDDIKEAYGKKQKYWLNIFNNIVDDCNRYIGNKKVTKIRKPREKKMKSAVDLVKALKYQKEFPPLKIVSVNPAEVVGCKQLWTYNTKARKITRYDASGPNGIQVKGTTLTGFDVETSLTKSVRKPDTFIPALLGAGKVALRSIIQELKTNETKPTGRINTDTVLLRVIK